MEKDYRARPIEGDVDMVALRKSVQERISVSRALLANVEERHAGYVARWLAHPEFRAALHRHDKGDGGSAI